MLSGSRSARFFSIIILYCTINCAVASIGYSEKSSSDDNNDKILRAIDELKFADFWENYLKNGKIEELNVTTECKKQMIIYFDGISNYEEWTLKMLDASSKLPSGIFKETVTDVGMFDECVSVKTTKKNTTINGRHCMYELSVKIPKWRIAIKPKLSICSPSACNSNDINNLLQSAVDHILERKNDLYLKIESVTCTDNNFGSWNDLGAIITVSVIGLFIGFLIICTICDFTAKVYLIDTNKKLILQSLCEFSLAKSYRRIFNTSTPNGNLPVISGMRFISMVWIITGHSYYNEIRTSFINKDEPSEWIRSWGAVSALVGHYAVDTFLVMSGILVSYIYLQVLNKGHGLQLIRFYIHRWLRLTPVLAVLIVIAIYIFPKLGSGPIWQIPMEMEMNSCSKNWWRILLYIHNYGGPENLMCLGYTWYLAVDMQLFWLSPLILIPLAKKKVFGLLMLTLLIIASIIIPAYIAVTNKFTWQLLFSLDEMATANMMSKYYVPTYTRAGPYLLGIFTGYLLVYKKFPTNKHVLRSGWLLTIFAFVFSTLSWRIFQMVDYEFNIYWELFHSGFSQHIWAFAICWIIYVSAHGAGGFISSFLSLPFFLPFSKISYCMYLLHFVIQAMKVNSARSPKYIFNFYMVNVFISDFVLTIIGGFIFSLLFESPVLTLEKLLTKKQKKKKTIDDEFTNNTVISATSTGINNYPVTISTISIKNQQPIV